MEKEDKLRVCKRCLLSEMADEREIWEIIRERIACLPPEEKAAAEEVKNRLSQCKACNQLNGGMCGLCGCYVELRTAKQRMHCPNLPPRW